MVRRIEDHIAPDGKLRLIVGCNEKEFLYGDEFESKT